MSCSAERGVGRAGAAERGRPSIPDDHWEHFFDHFEYVLRTIDVWS
ncbi:hypothetical protein [Actinacidiphila oryziradicis]|nr:hypothetical protein [Actinacidiphila oryziradicis]